MRTLGSIACLILTCTVVGCKSSDTKSARGDGGLFRGDPLAKGDGGGSKARNLPESRGRGILAGQVIDEFDRKVSRAVVRVVSNEDPVTGVAPIDYVRTANEEGFFAIENLSPGKTYQLVARVEYQGQVLTGTTTVRAPDPRVLIRLAPKSSEAAEPPALPPSSLPEEKGDDSPAASIDGPRGVSEERPQFGGDRGPTGSPSDPLSPPPLPDVDLGKPRRPVLDRTIKIRPLAGTSRSPNTEVVPRRRVPVPSCQRVGKKVYSFALNDLQGKPWYFPRSRQGKMVLLDFWHSRCGHCFAASPHLSRLQKEFGPRGLEVIGIACEQSRPDSAVRDVVTALSKHPMGYRILMSGYQGPNKPCPVQVQMGVSRFPTVLLLAEDGTIVWGSQGLSSQKLTELRTEINRRLPSARRR